MLVSVLFIDVSLCSAVLLQIMLFLPSDYALGSHYTETQEIIAVFGSPGKFTVSLHFLARKRAQPDKHDPLGIFGIIILCFLPDAGTKCIVFCYSPCYNTPHVDKRGASM